MLTLQQTFSDQPVWQKQVRPRLAVSMGIAVVLLAAVLLLLKFSPLPVMKNSMIELRLLADIEPPAAEPEEPQELVEPKAVVEPFEPLELIDPVEFVTPTALAEVVEPVEPQITDWYADAVNAAQETVAAAHHVDSMHTAFDEKRRQAAINFPASQAPVKKPIWENVETDQMGRKVLVSGGCYRVLEDWRVTYYEIQQAFGQFITYCNASNEYPMDVAWVDEIRKNYAYLNYRDGEIPPDLLSNLTRKSEPQFQE